MKKSKIKLIFAIFIILSSIRIIYFLLNNRVYQEETKAINATIIDKKTENDKTIIDVRQKEKYRITFYENIKYQIGDKVKIKATFLTPSNNTVFNLFNYRKYLLSKNIRLIGKNASIKLISKNKNPLYFIKNIVTNYINKYQSSSYLKAFLLADDGNISADAKTSYKNIGISHLLAISGMHVGILISLINRLFKKSKFKNMIVILLVLFMLFMTGFAESLLRCITVMLISILNDLFHLKLSKIKIIIISAFFLLILNPFLLYNVGFLFSFIITFFVILSNKYYKDKSYFSKTFIMSIICFCASVPILAFNFFRINVLSILFNIILIPVFSIVVFPLSIITVFLPFLDKVFYILTKGFELVAITFDKVKILTFIISKPNILIMILYYVFLTLAIVVNKKYIMVFIVILILNINSKFFILYPEVTYIDVGQGDCCIIILPTGKSIIIDTGGDVRSSYNAAEKRIIPYLNSKGISKVDLLILTHGDYDHMGNASFLVNNMNIKRVIFNNGEYNELEENLIRILKEKNIKYYKSMEKISVDNKVFQFLNTGVYDNENDNSNIIYFSYKSYKFLFMADATLAKENDLLKEYDLKNIDVLKVGHHGSDTSSGEKFIENVKPKYSVISVGKNNIYHHPKKSVLRILSDSKIYRTDIDGSIMFKIKNNKLKIKNCSP